MKEGDALAFRANPGRRVNELDAGFAASGENRFQIIHREADVVDSRPPFREKFTDGRVRVRSGEQLHQRPVGVEAANPGAVGIRERDLRETEYFPQERRALRQLANRDADVGDLRAART